MSENKTLLQKIKLLFEQEPTPPTPAEPVKMMVDVPLEDGTTILKVDKLEVGGVVTLNDMPAPDGEHKLADGKVIKTSGGVIVEIVPSEPVVVEDEMKKLPVQMASHKLEFAAKTKTQDAKIEALEKQNANQKEAITKLLEFCENLNTTVEKFGEQSKQKPAEVPWEQMTPLERRRASK